MQQIESQNFNLYGIAIQIPWHCFWPTLRSLRNVSIDRVNFYDFYPANITILPSIDYLCLVVLFVQYDKEKCS